MNLARFLTPNGSDLAVAEIKRRAAVVPLLVVAFCVRHTNDALRFAPRLPNVCGAHALQNVMTPYRVRVLALLRRDMFKRPLLAFLRNFGEYHDYQDSS